MTLIIVPVPAAAMLKKLRCLVKISSNADSALSICSQVTVSGGSKRMTLGLFRV